MSTLTSDSAWVSALEVAEMLGCAHATVRKWVREGRFTVRAIPGTRAVLLRSDVERFIATHIRPNTDTDN